MGLDLQKLTLGEVAKVEELSGQPISAIGDEDKPKGLAMAALAFVAKRREDPKFSWNAAQELTFDDAQAILGLTEDADAETGADPTEPSEQPSDNRAQKRAKK